MIWMYFYKKGLKRRVMNFRVSERLRKIKSISLVSIYPSYDPSRCCTTLFLSLYRYIVIRKRWPTPPFLEAAEIWFSAKWQKKVHVTFAPDLVEKLKFLAIIYTMRNLKFRYNHMIIFFVEGFRYYLAFPENLRLVFW